MLNTLRSEIDNKKTSIKLCETAKKRHMGSIEKIEAELEQLHEAREVFQKSAIMTQNFLANHLSSIVTKALNVVFPEKNMQFCVDFVERRNSSECDMWIEEDGRKYSLLDSRGYGLVDIVSFALKVSYVLLDGTANILVVDEPFRNLAKTRQGITSAMVKELSKELGIQFIITTHMESLKEEADSCIEVIQVNGVSKAVLKT